MGEQVQAYLKTVQEQIRWKRARPVLALELEQHLADQTEAFQAEGQDKDTAVRLALEDMGDPVELGAELDRVHRPRPQWGLLGLTMALAAVCGFLRFALDSGYLDGNIFLALGLGTVAMLGMYFLDISRLAKYSLRFYVCTVILCISLAWADQQYFLSFFSPFWHSLFLYAALFFPVVYALWVYWCRDKRWIGLALSWVGLFPLCVLCVCLPRLSAVIVILGTGFLILLHAAWKGWFGLSRLKGFMAVLLADAAFVGGILWRYSESISKRLQIALHPELDPMERGYYGFQIQNALRNLPLLGSSVETNGDIYDYHYFLCSTHDFRMTFTAVRWGWIPLLLLVTAMAVLIICLLARGLRQTHRLGRMIVLAVGLTMGLRLLLSTAMNLGFILFSVSFPMLNGNTYTVVDMALIGLALSVFRGDSIAREEFTPPPRRIRRIRLMVEYR